MKSTLFSIITLGLSLNAFAQTRPLPDVQPPKELVSGEFMEGTNTRLSKQDIDQFVPWAQNAQNVLTKALKDSKLMPVRERLNYIENSVRSVVRNSGAKNYQMFMRYSLNRGLLLSEELKKQANIEDIGIRENVLDILVNSINIALSFYESDLSFQRRAQGGNDSIAQDYSRFTLTFGRRMLVSIQNIHDASAEYRLLYKMYEMVNWDLSRDPNALNFSDQIVEIYDRLSSESEFPTQDDEDNLRKIRRLMLLKDSLFGVDTGKKFKLVHRYRDNAGGGILRTVVLNLDYWGVVESADFSQGNWFGISGKKHKAVLENGLLAFGDSTCNYYLEKTPTKVGEIIKYSFCHQELDEVLTVEEM